MILTCIKLCDFVFRFKPLNFVALKKKQSLLAQSYPKMSVFKPIYSSRITILLSGRIPKNFVPSGLLLG
jgi:hypothetical protein